MPASEIARRVGGVSERLVRYRIERLEAEGLIDADRFVTCSLRASTRSMPPPPSRRRARPRQLAAELEKRVDAMLVEYQEEAALEPNRLELHQLAIEQYPHLEGQDFLVLRGVSVSGGDNVVGCILGPTEEEVEQERAGDDPEQRPHRQRHPIADSKEGARLRARGMGSYAKPFRGLDAAAL